MSIAAGKNDLSLTRKKIDTSNLVVGMYIQELDRPWVETPYLFQGFKIKDQSEIAGLQDMCDHVYINLELGIDTPIEFNHSIAKSKPTTEQLIRIFSSSTGNGTYSDTTTLEQELETAKSIYHNAQQTLGNLFSRMQAGENISTPEVQSITNNVVDSILRNPDAFMLLGKLQQKDSHRFSRAVDTCALAASFCRHLEFPEDELRAIAMGALILDVGTIRLPAALLDKPGPLTPASIKLVRHHIEFGLDILNNSDGLPKVCTEMLATHHERFNGRGYPNRLKETQIPVSGRIAAIIDCYDAMTSERAYKQTLSPHEAICELYKWRGVDFPGELVEQFIQCIGIYPTGTLVELSSGQIGIIVSQNRVRHLYPRLLLVLNADKEHYEKPHALDLWEHAQKYKGRVMEIKKALDPRDVGLDPVDYYPLPD
jgi:HD-GYP domain-containing protein (c-di-GMP phosphodiesterase class II)